MKTTSQLAEETGIDRSTLSMYARDIGVKKIGRAYAWTKEQAEKAQEMYQDGIKRRGSPGHKTRQKLAKRVKNQISIITKARKGQKKEIARNRKKIKHQEELAKRGELEAIILPSNVREYR